MGDMGDPRLPGAEDVVEAIVVEEDLLVLGVDGRDGAAGRDGRTYAGSRAARARDGQDGEDATPAHPGEPAGTLELAPRPAGPGEQQLELVGRRNLPQGREQPVRETVYIGELGSVRLTARGGRGGNGGRGGDGEAGGKGQDGQDASRFSNGSDGDRGGDGGHGGDGTSGGTGGDGGRIVVQVDQRDTHLLMLLKADVSGGPGGQPGVNGRGGDSGPGGDGGRSHSWTTTSTEHYTDAQGHRQTRMVTHHHRNRGGSDGPSGNRGRDGNALLRSGPDGAAGEFRILVRDGNHLAQYRERFEVTILAYDLELADSFAEPTSDLHVRRLTVENTGGMPTPARCPVEFVLASSRWVQPRSHTLVLPRPLDPGERYTFRDESLPAEVPDLDTVPEGNPLRAQDRIAPLARQTAANRWYRNTHPRQEFTIAFPAELDVVCSLESQAPGRAALLTLGITNRSRTDLGRTSGPQRMLGARLELGNRALARHIMLLDMQGNQVAWDTSYREELDLLAAGASWSRQLILGILPGAPGYEQAELAVTLELGQRDAPGQPRDRHRRPYPVRVAKAYEYNPDADLLLITNHATTPEELEAWEQAAAQLGQTLGVWDISLNDSLSLAERLAHGRNLLRDFHGKTVILGNGAFATSLGTRHGDQLLSQMDLIKAAESHGIRVLIINDEQRDMAPLFQERLIPTDGDPEYRYDSIRAFAESGPQDDVEVLFDQVDELIRHGTQAARPDPTRQTAEIDVYGIRSPNRRRLRKQAARLQQHLQHATPGRRVVVMYRMPDELTAEQRHDRKRQEPPSGWFFTHDHQGTLTVMPTLGDNHPNVILLNAANPQIHDPAFIAGPRVAAALMQSLAFEEKVYLLGSRLRDFGEAWRTDRRLVTDGDVTLTRFLVDAILVDLATEQASVLKTGWLGLFSSRLVREALPQLRFLSEHPFTLITGDVEQPDVQLAARLLAGIELLGRTSTRWYESRVFPWSFFRRGPALRTAVLARHEQLVQNLFGRLNDERSRLLADQLQQYYQQLKQIRRQRKVDTRRAARRVMFAPLSDYAILTDAGGPFPGVLSYAEWQAVCQAESERDAARVALREKKEANRAAYGVARDGRPLPHVDATVERALQPFVTACEAANAELKQRARQATPKRVSQLVEPPPITEHEDVEDPATTRASIASEET